ncbi:hypothetical protein L226DRAFT_535089 [Lentinus tigrinus ALCF2SS1-7]|uniref:uncharacterized protein n=1 Tax=Lentinus tigrinus ALCF2SS1-7 TaxID=1328758 RepID=UPI0011663919|nr:hypothetical protein L226DRAFT_535089 [Lentinus tigrinus ALCF2SS1-7]
MLTVHGRVRCARHRRQTRVSSGRSGPQVPDSFLFPPGLRSSPDLIPESDFSARDVRSAVDLTIPLPCGGGLLVRDPDIRRNALHITQEPHELLPPRIMVHIARSPQPPGAPRHNPVS